ncbi:hypothetical protein RIF29_11786 [Crotalaria pallida]|uniref:Uncharacterized protein n=1 Tax=Crotalaria pallida TaxID=3830 RepID=A0AAN9P153_CROPI
MGKGPEFNLVIRIDEKFHSYNGINSYVIITNQTNIVAAALDAVDVDVAVAVAVAEVQLCCCEWLSMLDATVRVERLWSLE